MIIITGATSGIGMELAKHFTLKTRNICIHGRNAMKLDELFEQLKQLNHRTKIEKVVCNLNNIREIENTFQPVLDNNLIAVLINNAGGAIGFEHFHDSNLDDVQSMINTNFMAPLVLIKSVINKSISRKKPLHIINMSSLSAKKHYAKGAIYCSVKAAINVFTGILQEEVKNEHIKVTTINLGRVKTNFWINRMKGDPASHNEIYEDSHNHLTTEQVAPIIDYIVQLPFEIDIKSIDITHALF